MSQIVISNSTVGMSVGRRVGRRAGQGASNRAVMCVTTIFLGVSPSLAQPSVATGNTAASASSSLTNPPVFQGLMWMRRVRPSVGF
jgi:hypothetical protein